MAVSKPIIAAFFALSCLGGAALLDSIGAPPDTVADARADRLDLVASRPGPIFAAQASAGAEGARSVRPSVIQVFEGVRETTLVRIDLGE